MKITVTAGSGTGSTTLSAFDTALKEAGIHNYNIIKLSSVIPPESEVVVKKWKNAPTEHGKKLYTVLAEIRSDLLGRTIAAGIGWYQTKDGRGIFAEHHDIIESLNTKEAEENVAKKIESTVRDLCKNRSYPFNKRNFKTVISSAEVRDKPTCTLVAAVYESQDFDASSPTIG
ncbi:MAG: pyruvoyl-dependent arginine decarboxylase [Candidatus Woykebacteria bacterium]